MPAGPGESLLTTLFADIHYYFSGVDVKPQHHRFSRGSYFYLFNNPSLGQAKIEIANHAGTPDQDAFSGSLSSTRVAYTHKQPTLFTITVDGASIQGLDQWHIPSYNERNEQKYLYKIHSLDVYLWTEKDAATLLGHLKNSLPADRLEVKDAPEKLQTPAEHRDSMSPVVQQLERTAIGSHFPPRAESTTSGMSLPGPPTPASASATPAQQAAPMAYNPAAPAAPEPIAHREKTPPPIDDGQSNGLANAAKYDAMPQQQYANVPNMFASSQQATPQQSYFSGPPSASFPGSPRTASTGLPPPPPPPVGGPSPSYTPSFSGPPTSPPASAPATQQNFNHRQSSFGGPPGQTQFASFGPQSTPSFGPNAVASPGLPGTPGQLPPPPPSAGYQPGQGQYSQYAYTPQQAPVGGYQGDMHAQAYQPSAAEIAAKPKLAGRHQEWEQQQLLAQQQAQAQGGLPQQQQGLTMEGRVGAYEKKVGGFLKRLDKKFGV